MGTAVKHPVPDRVKPAFVNFDIWALYTQGFIAVPIWQQWVSRSCPSAAMQTGCRPAFILCLCNTAVWILLITLPVFNLSVQDRLDCAVFYIPANTV